MSKLLVIGGNGFIGTEICRIAVQNGHEVAAFGRTGRPALTPARDPWLGEVEWRAANVFQPETWRDLLDGADTIVHSLGTIMEVPERGITFDRINADSALLAANEASEAGVSSYVFLSAQDQPPAISEGFLAAKRRVERELSDAYTDLRTVALRPNLVYGPREQGSTTLAAVLNRLPARMAGRYASHNGRPLPVEIVAATAVHAATTATLEGTLSVPQIDDVARTSGLIDPDDVSQPSLAPLVVGVSGAALGTWLLHRWRSKS